MDAIMSEDDFDLSPILSFNAAAPNQTSGSNPADELAQVQLRPVSKRRGKKRSSRACTTCRTRKVRCNIVAHGSPCSNCRHDEIECVLPLSRRQRSARERAEALLRKTLIDSGNNITVASNLGTHVDKCAKAKIVPHSHDLAPHGMQVSEHPLAEILPVPSVCSSVPSLEQLTTTSSRTSSWIQIRAPLASTPRTSQSSRQLPTLPKIFGSFPAYVDLPGLYYLHSRDALTLPTERLQVEILKAYGEFVHGIMPLLDLEEFLSTVKYGCNTSGHKGHHSEREDENKFHLPLLLFQAVMFAGVGFVSTKVLRDAGYKSRESAQRALFSRVRLLYDFDTCTDRLSIIQSLLLMTFAAPTFSATPQDGKDAWHWLGLAISLSYSLGLNRGITQRGSSLRTKHLERRVWWTAFTRDRTLAISTRGQFSRPVRIKKGDCDVDMITLEDFDLSNYLNDGTDDDNDEIRVKQNAIGFIEKAILCWCTSDALLPRFPISATRIQQTHALMASQHFTKFGAQGRGGTPQKRTSTNDGTQHQKVITVNRIITTPFDTGSSSTDAPAAIFLPFDLDLDANLTTSPTPTQHSYESVFTPRDEKSDDPDKTNDLSGVGASEKLVIEIGNHIESPLGGGCGVDGEYDDYLELLDGNLKGLSTAKRTRNGETALSELDPSQTHYHVDVNDECRERERERSTWAFQLDCENGRVVAV